MIVGLSTGQWGAILVAASLVLLWMRIFKVTRAVMVFVGICLIGNGWLIRLLEDIARAGSNIFGGLFAKVFGSAVPGVLGLAAIGILIYDLHPRGGGASRRTYWVAVLVAVILVSGLAGFKALNGVPADVHQGVTTVTGG
jgi:hypothetical protein